MFKSAKFDRAPHWMTLLGTSEEGDRNYAPQIEGDLPTDLRGSLYRNGPGCFERSGHRVQHLLDGDGLVQRLSFTDAGVRYQNALIQTHKRQTEQAADKVLHANWTTRKPGGMLTNFGGGNITSQADVTIYTIYGKLIARDEIGPSYEIDPATLATVQPLPVGEALNLQSVGFKAHSKFDPQTQEWLLIGQEFGLKMKLHIVIYGPNFQLKRQYSVAVQRQVYLHDFWVSRRSIIFSLHPYTFHPVGFLAGLRSFTESCTWQPKQGNLIAVIPREGGPPQYFEAPSAFMWHSLNAFELGDELIADFVGYDTPDHFIGKDALLRTLMVGNFGHASAPGTLRRYRIQPQSKKLAEEIVDVGNHEFPMLNGQIATARHRVGYFATGGLGAFNTGVKRFDYHTGQADMFDFGPNTHVGEPIFVPKPGGEVDQGWLLAQCLDGATQRTFFALFDAQTVGKGAISKIWLTHSVPISFHGTWGL